MIEAGANALVAGSAVFGAPDYSEGTNCISCVRALFLALLITIMPTHAQQCNAVAIVLDAEKWKALETPYIVLPMQYVWMACVLRFYSICISQHSDMEVAYSVSRNWI